MIQLFKENDIFSRTNIMISRYISYRVTSLYMCIVSNLECNKQQFKYITRFLFCYLNIIKSKFEMLSVLAFRILYSLYRFKVERATK